MGTFSVTTQGILIRCYAGGSQKVLDNYIRISCGRPRDTDVFLAALDAMNAAAAVPQPKLLTTTLISSALGAHRPRAILWDMDGVLADVSSSYRRAIVETAAHFGAAGACVRAGVSFSVHILRADDGDEEFDKRAGVSFSVCTRCG